MLARGISLCKVSSSSRDWPGGRRRSFGEKGGERTNNVQDLHECSVLTLHRLKQGPCNGQSSVTTVTTLGTELHPRTITSRSTRCFVECTASMPGKPD